MKIQQDELDGKLLYRLDNGEEWTTEAHLSALTEFVERQAIETARHTKEYRRLVGRLDNLEGRIKNLTNEMPPANQINPKVFTSLGDITLAKIAKNYLEKGVNPEPLDEFIKEVLTRFSNQIFISLYENEKE
ncbi:MULTISPECIES: hypothetical protein [unclassified Microcoleus]|uniref:hypothetical protein n=1 Tax=unclassified Microcoleus TaxID=2642155 RepID=UPI002FD6FFC2